MTSHAQKTLRAFTLSLALTATGAFAKGKPVAELGPGAQSVEVTLRGRKATQFRVGAGKALTLTVTGPARVAFEVRAEGASEPIPPVAGVDIDGRVARRSRVAGALDSTATSERGTALSAPTRVAVKVAKGKHEVVFRWPARAKGDALLAIGGVKVTEAPIASILPLPIAPPPLPLPSPARPAAAPAKAIVREEPPKIVPAPAALPPASAPQTATVAASTPRPLGPVAGSQPAPALSDLSPRRHDAERWSVALIGGAERNSEHFVDSSGIAHFGLEATRTLLAALAVLQLDWRMGRQAYGSGRVGPSGAEVIRVDEQRFDAFLGIGYDFAPLLEIGNLTAVPVIGLKYIRLNNSAYPADLLGVDLMGRLRYGVTPSFGVHGSVGWMYNLVHPTVFSASGTPLGQLGVRAGFDFPLSSGYALSLDYQGDLVAFDFAYRVAHGASAGFGRSF